MNHDNAPSQMITPRLALVLAAGKGTRMKSELPKVLYPLLGRPMIEYVFDALEQAGIERIIPVIGYCRDLVRKTLGHRKNLEYVEQTELLGTGHAVMMCREKLADHPGLVLVVAGDCPLIQADSVAQLLAAFESAQEPLACVLGTAYKENPQGLGRILRDADGEFCGIVEEKDATGAQKTITEVNMSYYVFHASALLDALGDLRTNNAQQEYYLTDVPSALLSRGKRVVALPVLKPIEGLGINTVEEAEIAEEALKSMLR